MIISASQDRPPSRLNCLSNALIISDDEDDEDNDEDGGDGGGSICSDAACCIDQYNYNCSDISIGGRSDAACSMDQYNYNSSDIGIGGRSDAACMDRYNIYNGCDSAISGKSDAACIDRSNYNSSDSAGIVGDDDQNDNMKLHRHGLMLRMKIKDGYFIKCESPRSVLDLMQLPDHQRALVTQYIGNCNMINLSHANQYHHHNHLSTTASPLAFLHRCGFCASPLHGKDIFMYRY
jgi:hypothetical protein